MKLPALLFSIGMLAACAKNDPTPKATSLVPQAEQFMASYAQDLSRGDKVALAARYHPEGAYFLGNGRKEFTSHEAVVALYRDKWQAPSAFEWQDLSYEPLGTAGVLVLGKFKWLAADAKEPVIASYSGLLLMENGELKIRVEDESASPN
jgi:hypothetical protein